MSLAGSCPDNLGVGEMVQIALGGSQQRLRLHGVDCVSAITWVVAPNNVPNLIGDLECSGRCGTHRSECP